VSFALDGFFIRLLYISIELVLFHFIQFSSLFVYVGPLGTDLSSDSNAIGNTSWHPNRHYQITELYFSNYTEVSLLFFSLVFHCSFFVVVYEGGQTGRETDERKNGEYGFRRPEQDIE